jgi:hypothetical protein
VKSLLTVLFLALNCASCATSQPLRNAASSTTIPFIIFDNRILIEGLINGLGPYTFIFDTGGSNILTPEAAASLQLKMTNGNLISGAGEKKANSWNATVKQARFGDLVLNDQEFLILDLSSIRSAFHFHKLDGVIGYEILQKYVTAIDFEHQTLTFITPDTYHRPSTYSSLLTFRFQGEKPVVSGTIEGQPAELLLDTGDRSALTLYKRFAAKTKIDSKFSEKKEVISGYGVGGPIPAKIGNVRVLSLGNDISIANAWTRLPTTKTGIFAESSLSGSVGNEVLRRFNLIFNYPKKEVIVTKNSSFSEPFVFLAPPKQKAAE